MKLKKALPLLSIGLATIFLLSACSSSSNKVSSANGHPALSPTPSPSTSTTLSLTPSSSHVWSSPTALGITPLKFISIGAIQIPIPAPWFPEKISTADKAYLVTTSHDSTSQLLTFTLLPGKTTTISASLLSSIGVSLKANRPNATISIASYSLRWGEIHVFSPTSGEMYAWVILGENGEVILSTLSPAPLSLPSSTLPTTIGQGLAVEQVESILNFTFA